LMAAGRKSNQLVPVKNMTPIPARRRNPSNTKNTKR
jgi:hypothetical protein